MVNRARGWIGWAAACALALPCLAASSCELPKMGEPLGIGMLADAAGECFRAKQDAIGAKIFYAAMIRARAVSEAVGGDAKASADALQAQLGAPANRWLGGDLSEWGRSIGWALKWEAGSPWPESQLLGTAAPEALEAREGARSALAKMEADLAKIDRKAFYAKRVAAGLEVREPGFERPAGSKPASTPAGR